MKSILLFAALLPAAVCGAAAEAALVAAHARLAPAQGHKVHGLVTFVSRAGILYVKARIEGLTPGLHGFYIDQDGACGAPDGTGTGTGTGAGAGMAGLPPPGGDFGHLSAGDDGVATLDMLVPLTQIGLQAGADNNVRGRSLVVYGSPLALTAHGAGQAGRQACGVIRNGL